MDLKNANRDERDNLAAPTARVELLQNADGDVDVTGNDSKAKGSKRSKRKV